MEKSLKKMLCGGNYQLETPLGNWTHDQIWKYNWQWYISTHRKYLYQKMKDWRWYRCLQKPHLHRLYFNSPSVLSSIPTGGLFRSSIVKQRGGFFLKNYSHKYGTNLRGQERMFTLGILSFKYPQINWFLSYLSSSNNTDLLLDSIKKVKALEVSDGSFFPFKEVGSCA